MVKRELTIHKNHIMQTTQNNHNDIFKKKKERKEKGDSKMNARRRSVNKYDSKKPFVVQGSNNHTSETYVTGVYTPIDFCTL